jgi:hypothetical protein
MNRTPLLKTLRPFAYVVCAAALIACGLAFRAAGQVGLTAALACALVLGGGVLWQGRK